MNQSERPFETSAPARSPAGDSRDPLQQDVRPRIALILGGMLARHWLRSREESLEPQSARLIARSCGSEDSDGNARPSRDPSRIPGKSAHN